MAPIETTPEFHDDLASNIEVIPLGRLLLVAAAILLAVLLGLASTAQAQAPENPNAIELGFGLSYTSADGSDIDITSFRYSRDLRGVWDWEALFSVDFSDIDDSERFFDLSARRDLKISESWRLYAIGGVGAWFYDNIDFTTLTPDGFPATGSDGEESATAHLGLSFLWDFHRRAYLRTDLIYREYFDFPDFLSEDNYGTTLDLGWRF